MSLEAAILARLNQGSGGVIDDLIAKLPTIDSGTSAQVSVSDLDHLNTLFASAVGMEKVAASTTAMNAIAASTTAMNAIAASTTAMNAIAASTAAMNVLYSASTKYTHNVGWTPGNSVETPLFNGPGLLIRVTVNLNNAYAYFAPSGDVQAVWLDHIKHLFTEQGIPAGNNWPPNSVLTKPAVPVKFNSSLGHCGYTAYEIAYIPL